MQIAPICSGKANIAPRPCSPTAAPNPGHCCSCADKSSTSTGHPRLIAIPICWTFRSVFDTLDNIDKLAADINDAKTSLEAVDRILPQIITQLKSFVVPCVLRLLGPWFWWPTLVRSRPLPQR